MQDSWQKNHSSKSTFSAFPHSSSTPSLVSFSDDRPPTPPSSQISDQSGSILKEHDYISLAEVSSAASVMLAQNGNVTGDGKVSAGALTMEETDLRLSLGPLIDSKMQASRAEDIKKGQDSKFAFMEGQLEHRSSSQGGWQAAATTLRSIEGKCSTANAFVGSAGMPSTPATNGVKRGYSEAMAEIRSIPTNTGNGLVSIVNKVSQLTPEIDAKTLPKHQQAAFLSNWASPAVPRTDKSHDNNPASDNQDATSNDAPFPKGQVVGWPPVRAYRKNTLAAHLVKVNMGGVQWGRKIDLNAHTCYEGLLLALEQMFQCSSTNTSQSTSQTPPGRDHHLNDVKPFRLLNSSEFVLTYEDKDGDWMLVGDVPWGLFVNTVRRLRIMRGSEATGLGPEKPKCHA